MAVHALMFCGSCSPFYLSIYAFTSSTFDIVDELRSLVHYLLTLSLMLSVYASKQPSAVYQRQTHFAPWVTAPHPRALQHAGHAPPAPNTLTLAFRSIQGARQELIVKHLCAPCTEVAREHTKHVVDITSTEVTSCGPLTDAHACSTMGAVHADAQMPCFS